MIHPWQRTGLGSATRSKVESEEALQLRRWRPSSGFLAWGYSDCNDLNTTRSNDFAFIGGQWRLDERLSSKFQSKIIDICRPPFFLYAATFDQYLNRVTMMPICGLFRPVVGARFHHYCHYDCDRSSSSRATPNSPAISETLLALKLYNAGSVLCPARTPRKEKKHRTLDMEWEAHWVCARRGVAASWLLPCHEHRCYCQASESVHRVYHCCGLRIDLNRALYDFTRLTRIDRDEDSL